MKARVCKYWDSSQIQQWFGVSRATAYRGKKRGWIRLGYHHRVVIPAPNNPDIPIEMIIIPAIAAVKRLANLWGWKIDGWFWDAIQEACLRLLELSGHPDFGNFTFRWIAARNAASNFLRMNIRMVSELPENLAWKPAEGNEELFEKIFASLTEREAQILDRYLSGYRRDLPDKLVTKIKRTMFGETTSAGTAVSPHCGSGSNPERSPASSPGAG
ncbi:MAG: sigma-70 family RNA polymerase sigma factor [Calditrichaeota bacterium]|nr:sigma-70 family RNA polymerase sigma factor [Calditrichota bacterium]